MSIGDSIFVVNSCRLDTVDEMSVTYASAKQFRARHAAENRNSGEWLFRASGEGSKWFATKRAALEYNVARAVAAVEAAKSELQRRRTALGMAESQLEKL